MLERLNNEIKKIGNNFGNNDPINTRDESYNSFVKLVLNVEKSKINDIFSVVKTTISKCSGCNNVNYNTLHEYVINFPLDDVYNYKVSNNKSTSTTSMNNNVTSQQNINNNYYINMNNNMGYPNMNMNNNMGYPNMNMNNNMGYPNMNMNNNMVDKINIYDCFDYDRKCSIMSGDNRDYCNTCRDFRDTYKWTSLETCPEVLILLLNRDKNKDVLVKCEIPEQLDIANYVYRKESGTNYELIGVVTYCGELKNKGHYIAYCKNHFSKNWIRYNDTIVEDNQDFQEKVIGEGVPYILFYQKVHEN